jgi:hypothetical protein
MEKHYVLDQKAASCGRTLLNNLVKGNRSTPLDYIKDFRLSPGCLRTGPTYSFDYLDIGEVIIHNEDVLSIKADNEFNLEKTESKLKQICLEKGIPILSLKTNL